MKKKKRDVTKETDIEHAKAVCAEIPVLREQMQKSGDVLDDIEERKEKAQTDYEREIFDFMEKEERQKNAPVQNRLSQIIRCFFAVRHPDAQSVLKQYYLDGIPLKNVKDGNGIEYGIERAKYYKRIGMNELAEQMKKATIIK